MTSTSIINLSGHIAAVAYSYFVLIPDRWSQQQKSSGAKEMLNLLYKCTSSYYRPIFPTYILNEDCSNQNYFSGSYKAYHSNNGWLRVITDSLTKRNKHSVWTTEKSKGNIYKGVRVKFSCVKYAGGFLYPICIIISNLS